MKRSLQTPNLQGHTPRLAQALSAAGTVGMLGLLSACGSDSDASTSRGELTAAESDGVEGNDQGDGAEVPFTVLKTSNCAFSEPDRLVQEVIRDQTAFDEALANVNSTGELPTVNFETSMVVGATTWRLKGCTTDLKIKSVEERANDVSVTLMLHNHCISLGAESWPYVFAEIPRIDKPFVFTETEIWDECPE